MLGFHIPSHHIFLTINTPNSEVEHLHKFEQALPYLCRICSQVCVLVIRVTRSIHKILPDLVHDKCTQWSSKQQLLFS